MLLQREREQVAEYGRRMSAAGLSTGTSGNLSVFAPERGLMAVSPSGMAYGEITARDVAVADLEGRVADGERRPSSEWALHAAFYRRKPEARGVVHTHSVFCTTLAALGQPIRAVHYVLADAGADEVPCAPYAAFGTAELARAALDACGESRAVLLANHGLAACGASLPDAYSLACELEFVAQVQYRAMCAGTPRVLTPAQLAEAAERFKSYGQR